MVSLAEGKNFQDTATQDNFKSGVSPSEELKFVADAEGEPVILHEETLAGTIEGVQDAIIVAKPAAGTHVDVELAVGQKYVFTFPEIAIEAFAQDAKDLIINFTDGSSVTLKNFEAAVHAENAAVLTFSDQAADGHIAGLIKIIELPPVYPEEELAAKPKSELRDQDEAAQVSAVEPAAGGEEATEVAATKALEAAEKAAAIEPAAGAEAGARGGSASGGGYGFQSTFDAGSINALNDVGPIDPTALNYGIPSVRDDIFFDVPRAVDPTINPPSILINNGVSSAFVKEDGSVGIPVSAALGADAASDEYLVVTVTGIDPAWGSFSAPVGTYDAATGTWTITLASGQSLDTVFTFSPNGDSDLDLTGLIATATSYSPSEGLSASAQDTFDVITDAVADAPDLDAANAHGEEGTTIPLNITTSLNDTDGSEILEVIKVGNVPAGATLTAGTYDAVHNVWVLTPVQLVGLGIYIPDGLTGNYVLSVESVSFEQNTSGVELDTTDNRASAFDSIRLCISPDDVPVVSPSVVAVDETNLDPIASVNGTVNVDFGADTVGTVHGSGSSVVGALTSGGVPVSVTFDAVNNVYSGAAAGSPVFTLAISNNGAYVFTLLAPVDHSDANDHNSSLPLQFGITATDSEGDAVNGTITVNVFDDGVTAHDDTGSYDPVTEVASGDVTDNDTLSKDLDNAVSKVAFGAHIVDVDPVHGADIDGTYGTLHINADGTYSYTLFPSSGGGFGGGAALPPSRLAPLFSDVAGLQTTLTKDDITVSVVNPGNFDLVWVTSPDGNGIGIDNLDTNDSKKILPRGETLNISTKNDAQTVAITIAEIGDNNDDGFHGAEYVITFADGTTASGEQQFDPAHIVNGHFEFVLDAANYGGKLISSVAINSLDTGTYLGASMLLGDVKATYPSVDPSFADEFTYTLRDGDGDFDTAVLKIEGDLPQGKLVVGQNVNDDAHSTTDHLVGGGEGVIAGGTGSDILVGDAGGSIITHQTQDYNFVFILDVSGSMAYSVDSGGETKINLLKDAVKSLLADMSSYADGEIKVHIVPFSTTAQNEATFTLNAANLTAIDAYIDALRADGLTNYESPMQAAISWLQGGEPFGGNAITSTYFISDGAPNRYINSSGGVSTADASGALGQVLGSDGTNEAAILHSLNDNFIAVGVDIGSSIARLDAIDPSGHALNIDDPADLKFALANTAPIKTLNAAGDDVLEGGAGHDIIFGDILFTDTLATTHGISLETGAGWEVFERLENGESASHASWDRDDTIAYILSHAAELSAESLDAQNHGRSGGNDIIHAGAGDDLVFGQEGNDLIHGGAGHDTIYGGSGTDTFVYQSLTEGTDTIKDFHISEGDRIDLSAILTAFDPLTDDISHFVIATEDAGNTVISVDVTGAGGASGSTLLVTLEGVTGLDLEHAIKTGTV